MSSPEMPPQFGPKGDLIPYMGSTGVGDPIHYHSVNGKGDAGPPELMRTDAHGDPSPFMASTPTGDGIPYPIPPGGNPFALPTIDPAAEAARAYASGQMRRAPQPSQTWVPNPPNIDPGVGAPNADPNAVQQALASLLDSYVVRDNYKMGRNAVTLPPRPTERPVARQESRHGPVYYAVAAAAAALLVWGVSGRDDEASGPFTAVVAEVMGEPAPDEEPPLTTLP